MSFFEKLKLHIEELDKMEELNKEKKRQRIPKKIERKRKTKAQKEGPEEQIKTEEQIEKDVPEKVQQKQELEEKKEAKIKKVWPKKEAKEGELTIDVYETEKELVVQSPVAGIKPEELEIIIEDEMLTIKGERPYPEREEEAKTLLEECFWGPFSRRIVLPVEVDTNRIKASLEQGILTIRMPKVESKKKRRIIVEEWSE